MMGRRTTSEGVDVANVYKKIELVGTSTEGIDDAVRGAIKKAAESVRNLDWFEVKEVRGHLEDGEIAHFQVSLKVGFRLEEGESG